MSGRGIVSCAAGPRLSPQFEHPWQWRVESSPDRENPSMNRHASAALLSILLASGPALAQTAGPASPTPPEKTASPEIAACKAAALKSISATEPEIKDIYIDEDGASVATAETQVEDTPIKRIIMGESYLRTDRSDKPRRFLCLIGEEGKVLLTFFTVR
jgi:hypothetical protein